MSLTQYEKDLLVSLQIEKSDRFMEQADKLLDMGMTDAATNRYYYSCFHAVNGLFIKEGINAHRHRGMLIQFSLHFVKTGKVSKEIGAILSRMEQMREEADYNCHYDITEEEAKALKPQAKRLIETVKELLNQQPKETTKQK